MFIYIYTCMGNSTKCGEFGMSYNSIFIDYLSSIIAMRFSLTLRTIENVGPSFLVAHGSIGNFEAMTRDHHFTIHQQ
jgi:hypothetical protein